MSAFNENKTVLLKVRALIAKASYLFNTIPRDAQNEINNVHNEGFSIGHCLRWGSQAGDELASVIRDSSGLQMEINDAQRGFLDNYENGEFSHIRTQEDLDNCGDGLVQFIFVELSTNEDCDSLEEGRRRIRSAITQLENYMETPTPVTATKRVFP